MSKPPKTDFRALIAGAIAPAAPAEPATATKTGSPVGQDGSSEIVALKPRRRAPAQGPTGTLKERAHQLSLYLEPPVYEALREIAHVERTKLHPLILEGIDLLLKKRGAASIRELTKAKAG